MTRLYRWLAVWMLVPGTSYAQAPENPLVLRQGERIECNRPRDSQAAGPNRTLDITIGSMPSRTIEAFVVIDSAGRVSEGAVRVFPPLGGTLNEVISYGMRADSVRGLVGVVSKMTIRDSAGRLSVEQSSMTPATERQIADFDLFARGLAQICRR